MVPRRFPIAYWTSRTRLTPPKVITFDAYQTLYGAKRPILEQYSIISAKYGINVDIKTLKSRYVAAWWEFKKKYPLYGKYNGISPAGFWRELVRKTFEPERLPNEALDEILKRFEGEEAYTVYPDVLHLLKFLKAKHPDIALGIISNTDPTMYKVLDNLGLSEYFDGCIYLSYDLEIGKPDKEVFDYALADITKKRPELLRDCKLEELKKRCWHIGDELEKDLRGANAAGWNSILIDRENYNNFFDRESLNSPQHSEKLLTISKLEHHAENVWEASMDMNDTLEITDTKYAISNFKPFIQMFFGGDETNT